MGLKGGPEGAKAFLKRQYPHQFRVFDQLASAREATLTVGAEGEGEVPMRRDQTCVLVDGNVLMMAVPGNIKTVADYADIIFNYLRRDAMNAGSLVIVVFDEPEAMTWAKKEEQNLRDARRTAKDVTCSVDIAPPPLPLAFTREELHAYGDVGALRADRRYKSRVYDEVIKLVFDRIGPILLQWASNGHHAGAVLLDGVEPRGCDLPAGEKRQPVLLGTDAEVTAAFARGEVTGEGDIKLQIQERRLRELKATHPAFSRYELCLTWTIDTDSFMTLLIDVAKRRVDPYPLAVKSLFCMREPPSKREREESQGSAKATWLCCDTQLLEHKLQAHFWGARRGPVNPKQLLQAMLAFASATALCGCDFTSTGQKGARFDHFWESFPTFVAEEPKALERFEMLLLNDAEKARGAVNSLLRVCYQASRHMETKPQGSGARTTRTYKKASGEVWDVGETMLRRSLWAASYWALNEFEADSQWGFSPDLTKI